MTKVAEQEKPVADENEEIVDVDAEVETKVEVKAEEEASEVKIPEKFQGKSLEDVIKSYEELEKYSGSLKTEVGQLRKFSQQITEQFSERGNPKEESTEKASAIDVDSLLDDPEKALSTAIENNPRLKAIEEALVKGSREESKTAFESKHPNWQEVAASEGFQNWVQSSQVRKDMFMNAHKNFDYGVASELFEWYGQTHKPEINAEEVEKAEVESGGVKTKRVKKFRKSDIDKMRRFDRDRYDAMQPEIIKAYQEGRVIRDA